MPAFSRCNAEAAKWKGEVPKGITAVVRSSTDLVFVIPRVFKESSVEDIKAVQPVSLFRFLVAALSRAVVAAAVWGGCEGGLSVTAVVERTIFARAVEFEKKFSPSAFKRDGLRWFRISQLLCPGP